MEPTNSEIMQKLGELSGTLSGILRENDAAAESRRAVYLRLEEQNKSLSALGTTVEIGIQATAQLRDRVENLAAEQKTMAENIGPIVEIKDHLPGIVDGWRDLQRTGAKIVWLLGVAGASIIGGVIWFGGLVVQWLQHILGITPPPG